jgi:predicted nucleic acid-binding protein
MDSKDYVLDANIVVSMLISGRAQTLAFLSQFSIYSPDFIVQELDLYTDLIRGKTKLTDEQLSRYTLSLFRQLTIVPRLCIGESMVKAAHQLCSGIDIKDTAYVAVACQLGCSLVTRDKTLYTGLRRKGFRSVILFDDFLGSI